MGKKDKKVVEIQQAETPVPPAPEKTLELIVVRVDVPTYTIHADTRWGMLAMLALHRLVQEWDAPEDLRREIERKTREFELYEAAHRGDPHS